MTEEEKKQSEIVSKEIGQICGLLTPRNLDYLLKEAKRIQEIQINTKNDIAENNVCL